jgi:hypothetical protein
LARESSSGAAVVSTAGARFTSAGAASCNKSDAASCKKSDIGSKLTFLRIYYFSSFSAASTFFFRTPPNLSFILS